MDMVLWAILAAILVLVASGCVLTRPKAATSPPAK